jgi:hypothetical protein
VTAILETNRLTKRYGVARGIEKVSISVERGEVHGRSVLIWGVSLGVYGAFRAAIYPSIQGSIENIAKSYTAGLRRPLACTR